jgi:hypothetical protein
LAAINRILRGPGARRSSSRSFVAPVLFGMQNRTSGPYLTAINRILLGPAFHLSQLRLRRSCAMVELVHLNAKDWHAAILTAINRILLAHPNAKEWQTELGMPPYTWRGVRR